MSVSPVADRPARRRRAGAARRLCRSQASTFVGLACAATLLSGLGSAEGHALGATAGARHLPNPAFAGYVTHQTGAAVVTTRFRAPKFRCLVLTGASPGETLTAVGERAALGEGAFMLAGPDSHESFDAAALTVGCRSRDNAAIDREALVVNGRPYDFHRPVRAGDLLTSRVSTEPGGRTVVTLKDSAAQRRFTVTASGAGSSADEELVGDYSVTDRTSGQKLPQPESVAPTTFGGVDVDGHPLGGAGTVVYDMTTPELALEIKTGSLSGERRDTFTCRKVDNVTAA